jgi:hypothetical protein
MKLHIILQEQLPKEKSEKDVASPEKNLYILLRI